MLDMSQMTVKYWGKSYSKLRESRDKLAWLSGGRNLERVEKLAPATQVREGAGESDGLRPYGLQLAWAEIHRDWAARGGIGAERTQQRVAGGRAVRVRESHTHT